MATHSSLLAWRIPGTGEPGGLPSMGVHRVRHNWSDLAAAAERLTNTSTTRQISVRRTSLLQRSLLDGDQPPEFNFHPSGKNAWFNRAEWGWGGMGGMWWWWKRSTITLWWWLTLLSVQKTSVHFKWVKFIVCQLHKTQKPWQVETLSNLQLGS